VETGLASCPSVLHLDSGGKALPLAQLKERMELSAQGSYHVRTAEEVERM